MKKEHCIRFVKPADMDALTKLCTLHAHYEKTHYDSRGKSNRLDQYLFSEYPSLYCLVVEHSKKLIGYATYMRQFSTWDADFYVYMDCLFLSEESRGYGIGEMLIDRIKEEGKKMGCSMIQWQTPNFNERAIKFYYRIGATAKQKERFSLKI